jgi:ectoine hydroxylase-related dioxygenase (phytanoyl-CoA dioxygenase family)
VAFRTSGQHKYVCSFHYLSDVTSESPSFGVIPQSCVFSPVPAAEADNATGTEQLRRHLSAGGAYQEMPIYAKAGSVVLYDISLYHSRVNPSHGGTVTRRALQVSDVSTY